MMNRKNETTSDGGVSESIGFLLIFTMVIVGIGLVTLYGYPLLLQQQTSADEQIMEKNMIVLQNDMKSLAYKTIPYKETMLNIGGGSLTVYNTSSTPASSIINIVDDITGNYYVNDFKSGDLRYYSTSAGVDISLQNGAVVMRKLVEPGSVMLAQPRWFYDGTTNTMVINLISLNSTERISRSGVGTVQMAIGETTFSVTNPINDVCLEFIPDNSPNGQDYSTAWDNYFVSMKMIKGGGGCNAQEYLLPFDYSRPATLVIKKSDVVITSL